MKKLKLINLNESQNEIATLNQVNSMLNKEFPGLEVAKADSEDGEYWYWYSDDEKIGLYLAGLYGTTVDSYMSLDSWRKEAQEIMQGFSE